MSIAELREHDIEREMITQRPLQMQPPTGLPGDAVDRMHQRESSGPSCLLFQPRQAEASVELRQYGIRSQPLRR